MRNLTRLLKTIITGPLFFLTACIKDPSPDVPHPPKPEWLLTKVVTLERRGEPEGGPVYYEALVDRFHYNAQHKPWLHTQHRGQDTNHMTISAADTLFYDKQLRPLRSGHFTVYSRSTTEGRYFYTGDDRYPERIESTITDSTGTRPYGNVRYLYRDTMVFSFFSAQKDSFAYVYNRQGDCIGTYSPPFGVYVQYPEYDNAVNVGRYLNLETSHGMRVPQTDNGPLLSAHNWTSDAMDWLQRTITYDSMGRVSSTHVQYQFPTRDVNTHYYYSLIE